MPVNSETLESLSTLARDILNEGGDKLISNTLLAMWLNQAMLRGISLIGRLEKEETIITVSGQAGYAFPSDHKDTIDVQYQSSAENRLLGYITPQAYRGLSLVDLGDLPWNYTIINEDLTIYPTPGASGLTISHRYDANVQKMSEAEDVPYNGLARFFPYHLDLLDYVNAQARLKAGDQNGHQLYMGQFNSSLSIMQRALSSKRKTGGQFQRHDNNQNMRNSRVGLPANYPRIC